MLLCPTEFVMGTEAEGPARSGWSSLATGIATWLGAAAAEAAARALSLIHI